MNNNNIFLTFKEIEKVYDKIKYKGGKKWYLLKDYYPICMEVKDKKNSIYLDTGGQMVDCTFDVFQMTKTELYSNGEKITNIKIPNKKEK